MGFRQQVTQGLQAGLLAGVTVAVVFFVTDLAQLSPLATPAALQRAFMGPGGTVLEFPLEARLAALVVFAIHLISFTVLHLLAFAVLGVGAAFVLSGRRFAACMLGGACYGLVVCSTVFYGSLALTGTHLVAEIPGIAAVVGANLVAGAVMGAYLGLGGEPA